MSADLRMHQYLLFIFSGVACYKPPITKLICTAIVFWWVFLGRNSYRSCWNQHVLELEIFNNETPAIGRTFALKWDIKACQNGVVTYIAHMLQSLPGKQNMPLEWTGLTRCQYLALSHFHQQLWPEYTANHDDIANVCPFGSPR